MKKLFVLATICGGMVLTACNTIEGIGRDVESVGETVATEAQ